MLPESYVRIETDPTKWPLSTFRGRGTYAHIRFDQPVPPPDALFDVALPQWGLRRPRVGTLENWWKDLSAFDPSLKGWKLVGRGDMPQTVLNPKEQPRRGDRKLALYIDEILDGYQPFGAGGQQ